MSRPDPSFAPRRTVSSTTCVTVVVGVLPAGAVVLAGSAVPALSAAAVRPPSESTVTPAAIVVFKLRMSFS
jgi:hypothetical protein